MVFFQIYRSYRRNILLSAIGYGNPLNNEWYQPAQHVQDDLSRHPATTIMYIPCRAYHLLGRDKKINYGIEPYHAKWCSWRRTAKILARLRTSLFAHAISFSTRQRAGYLGSMNGWACEYQWSKFKIHVLPTFFMTRLYWSMLFHDPYTLIIHIHLTTVLTPGHDKTFNIIFFCTLNYHISVNGLERLINRTILSQVLL